MQRASVGLGLKPVNRLRQKADFAAGTGHRDPLAAQILKHVLADEAALGALDRPVHAGQVATVDRRFVPAS